MLKILAVVTVSILLLVTTPVQAWFDGGHMVVAYIAYQKTGSRDACALPSSS